METLHELLDGGTIDGLERDRGVTGVVDGNRRQNDLLAGFRCSSIRTRQLVDPHGGQLDAIDDENRLVAGHEVDKDSCLAQDAVPGPRIDRLDRVRKLLGITARDGSGEPESDHHQTCRDRKADERESRIDPAAGSRTGHESILTPTTPRSHLVVRSDLPPAGWCQYRRGARCPRGARTR